VHVAFDLACKDSSRIFSEEAAISCYTYVLSCQTGSRSHPLRGRLAHFVYQTGLRATPPLSLRPRATQLLTQTRSGWSQKTRGWYLAARWLVS